MALTTTISEKRDSSFKPGTLYQEYIDLSSLDSTGEETLIAGVALKQIQVQSLIIASTTATVITLKSGSDAALPPISLSTVGGFKEIGGRDSVLFACSTGASLNLVSTVPSLAEAGVYIQYRYRDAD